MRIRPVRCSGRRGTTHAIPFKASSCTRRRLTSSARPNDGFWTSVAPAVLDQLPDAGGFVNQQTVHDDDVAACSSRSRSMSTRRAGSDTLCGQSSSRRAFSADFIRTLADDFRLHGRQAIEKVRKTQPAAYMNICALLVPKG